MMFSNVRHPCPDESIAILESDLLLDNNGLKKHADVTEIHSPVGIRFSSDRKVFSHFPYSLKVSQQCQLGCSCERCLSVDSLMISDDAEAQLGPEAGAQPADEAELAHLRRFMPPPPPRLDTLLVLQLCGSKHADAIIEQMMLRWFEKTTAVECFFVRSFDRCPVPNPQAYDFNEWCRLANDWWFRNFRAE